MFFRAIPAAESRSFYSRDLSLAAPCVSINSSLYNEFVPTLRRRDGRVAEGARLESVYTLTGIVGSNPTLSAIQSAQKFYHGMFTNYGFKTNAQVSEVNEQNRHWLIQHNVVTPDKNGNTIDWNKANASQVRKTYDEV